MTTWTHALKRGLTGGCLTVAAMVFAPSPTTAETFHCESTRTPNGAAKYCNFLLFDAAFSRHRQIVVAQGARRKIDLNERYDVFCVLVQNHRGVPDNIAYRKQQCRTSDTGRNYQFVIREFNMRRGRNGFSTNAPQLTRPADRW